MSDSTADKLAKDAAASMYERDYAVQGAGIGIDEVRPGFASLSMMIRPDMVNGHAVCHGGYIFLLADTAFAYACNSYNEVSYAQTCDIGFIRAGRQGKRLVAVAEERRRGGVTGLYDVAVSTEEGELIAMFRGRSYEIGGSVIQE